MRNDLINNYKSVRRVKGFYVVQSSNRKQINSSNSYSFGILERIIFLKGRSNQFQTSTKLIYFVLRCSNKLICLFSEFFKHRKISYIMIKYDFHCLTDVFNNQLNNVALLELIKMPEALVNSLPLSRNVKISVFTLASIVNFQNVVCSKL